MPLENDRLPTRGLCVRALIKLVLRYPVSSSDLAIAVMAATLSFPTLANQDNSHDVKLLQAHFDSRSVVQVEAGDFHFKPGQVAPYTRIQHRRWVMW